MKKYRFSDGKLGGIFLVSIHFYAYSKLTFYYSQLSFTLYKREAVNKEIRRHDTTILSILIDTTDGSNTFKRNKSSYGLQIGKSCFVSHLVSMDTKHFLSVNAHKSF